MRPRALATVGLAAMLQACAPKGDPYEAHLQRELSFLKTGVDVDAEQRAEIRALHSAGLEPVAERSGPGMRAIGAASARFARTAVRVISGRGLVEAEDAARDDVFAPGRVHLLEDTPADLEGRPVVGWVRVDEGATAGCARLRIIDVAGRPLPLSLQPLGSFATACAAGLTRREGRLWGSLAWPELTAAATPHLELPLAPVKGRLDSNEPVTKLRLDEREGWVGEARKRRMDALAKAGEFGLRHAPAVELAALDLLAGEAAETQRAAYTQHAGTPSAGFERALWARTVALIERGWAAEAPPCGTNGGGSEPCAEQPKSDVLQEPVHGEEAQKEELPR